MCSVLASTNNASSVYKAVSAVQSVYGYAVAIGSDTVCMLLYHSVLMM